MVKLLLARKWSVLFELIKNTLAIVLIYLKVSGAIDWSLVWVTLPIWGVYAFILLAPVIVGVCQFGINILINRKNKRENETRS